MALELCYEGIEPIFSLLHEAGKFITPDYSWIDHLLDSTRSITGLSAFHFNLMLCTFGTYPISFIFRSLPNVTSKHLFSLIVGVLFVQFCSREYWIHSLLTTTLSYLFTVLLPRQVSPLATSVLAVVWVSASHIYRIFRPDIDWDFSGVQMVLTIKLTSMAFNILDGQLLADADGMKGVPQRIVEERRSRSLKTTPTALEYFSFMYFFGGILTGPAFDFVEFSTSVDLSKYGKGKAIPSPLIPALKRLASSLFFLALYLVLSAQYNEHYLQSPEFLEQGNFFSRLLKLFLFVFVQKSKFFFVWLMTEGGCILCSFGYEGENSPGDHWSGLSNIDIVAHQTSQSIRDATVTWNKNTSLWLRRYVYERVPAPFSLFSTYLVSAFWHGFYPGYYAFFLSASFGQETARAIRHKIRPYFMERDGKTPKPFKFVYDFLGFLLTNAMIAYTASAFFALSLQSTLAVWRSLYFFGHVLIFLPWFFLWLIPNQPKPVSKKD